MTTFEEKWNNLLKIPNKIESDGVGTDTTDPEGMRQIVELFKKVAPPETHKQILDIGAGDGTETNLLEEVGYEVIGITYGRENIRYALKKYEIMLVEMDMHDLKFPDEHFDGIFTVQSFEHAFAPWLVIIEMRRVLRDGGIVLIDVPDANDQAMLDTIWHTNVLFPNQIHTLFKKAGFKLRKDFTEKHRNSMFFEKLPDGEFEMWGYVHWLMGK